ncbi:MAG: YgjP-like metallopeptidase domain-containing protein [Candidatus Aenigmatarchaeota archaeon]
MRNLTIFGKDFMIIEQKSNEDSVKLEDNKIYVNTYEKTANFLLKEFLENLLYSQLVKIYDQIMKRKKIEIFGNLDFEIVEKIDNKKQRIAKLKGNKILIKLNAIALPKSALKYIIAHEIAHMFTKRHTKRFWKIVELMCPNFKKNQELLIKYSDFIISKLIHEK